MEKELALTLSMNVITWPSPDMAKSDVIMLEEWVSASFDFNYNFMFCTSKNSQKGALEAS